MLDLIIYKNLKIKTFDNILKKNFLNIINYLNKESKNWSNNNETPVSLYDKNLKNYGLDNFFFQDLYFLLKKDIESTTNKNFTNVSYIFKKNNKTKDNINDDEFYETILCIKDKKENIEYFIICKWKELDISKQEYFKNIYINNEIFYYKEFIKNPKNIIKQIEHLNQNWKFYSTKESNKQPFENSSYEFAEYKIIDKNILGKELLECIKDYEVKNNIAINNFTKMVVTKSYPGKILGNHVDSNEDTNSPDLTVIVDLNDNYEGGEIEFPDHNLLLKPFAGSILIYPSIEPYYHFPHSISLGHKISCIMYGFSNKKKGLYENNQV